MKASRYFRNQLFLAMLVVAVPLLLLQASRLWTARSHAKDAAYLSVQHESEKAAWLIDAALRRGEGLLSFLSTRPEITAPDPEQCTNLLKGIPSMDRVFVDVVLFDVQGQGVCAASLAAVSPLESVQGASWFGPALAADGFRLSRPLSAQVSRRQVVLLTLPVKVRESSGGLLVLSLSIEELSAAMGIHRLPTGSASALINESDVMVSRNPDPLLWVDRSVSDETRAARYLADGPVHAVGADGVARIFASTSLNHFGLRVATGVPVASVFGPIRKTALQNASVVLAFAVLAAFLAWLGSRRLSSPLRQLMLMAKSNSDGDMRARAPPELPGEFGELSAELNRMLDAHGSADGHLREAERKTRRMVAFYEALSKTNRAIASQLPPQAIFDTICKICVDTHCAHIAWIAEAEGTTLRVVAMSGWPEATKSDIAVVLAEDGPTATALRQELSRFLGDTGADQSVDAWKACAALSTAGSAAAFPVRRGGVVRAVLTLYVKQPGAFDDKLVRLIGEMAADVSFGLDNFDKAMASIRQDSQLAAIVETATDAIITLDHLLNIQVFNSAASRMFGASARSVLGSSAEMLVPERFRASATSGLKQFMAGDADVLLSGEPRDFVGLRSSGAEFPLQATFSRVGLDSETLVTCVLRDITALRESEQHLKAAAAHEAANVAKTTFLSNMSHELRTPLTAVTGFAQLLLTGTEGRLDARERHQLAMILLAGKQLAALVDDVLDVSRIEVGRIGISMQSVELIHHIDSVLQMCDESASVNAVTFVRGYADGAPLTIHSDPTRLRQVLLNVVTNAIKYNRRGGTVRVDIDRGADRICIRVADTGMGLSKSQTDRLYEPFNRLGRERGEIPGTGIGLMLSRQLVELMGGTISLSSVEGSGTEVSIELPAHVPAPKHSLSDKLALAGAASIDRGPETVPPDLPEPSGTVLYIEDNPVNVILVQAVLAPWSGVEVVVAVDAAEGLAQAFGLRQT